MISSNVDISFICRSASDFINKSINIYRWYMDQAYAMEINVKKTKVMVVSQEGNVQCKVVLNRAELEQVKRYKYLGSWISEDLKCGEELISRIGLAKAAFWKNKELLRRNFLRRQR